MQEKTSMDTVCKQDLCNGCMACINVCNKGAISIKDTLDAYNAVIDEKKCVHCNRCMQICPRNSTLDFKKPQLWLQGWAKEKNIREKSSSGGYATAIMSAFAERDNCYVVSCVYSGGKFVFDVAESSKECGRFAGSKYIKSNPVDAYKLVKKLLNENKKVLFLGLPCQVAGIKNYVGKNLEENLYTIDLICHGTPSPELLKRYLRESYKKELQNFKNITFRKKNNFDLHEEGVRLTPASIQDRYTIAFLDSLDYTKNCYSCEYARTERISDLSLGDSWATQLPQDEVQKGISLALCQTNKGRYLLDIADIVQFPVDIEASILANKQLQRPSVLPKQRAKFFKRLKKSLSFSDSVLLAYPQKCLKQDIKSTLHRFGLWGGAERQVTNMYTITYYEKDDV